MSSKFRRKIKYVIKKEKDSLDFLRKKGIKGRICIIAIDVVIGVTIVYLIISSFLSVKTASALTVDERLAYLPPVKCEEEFLATKEDVKKLSLGKAFYSVELSEEYKDIIVNNVYHVAKKTSNTVNKRQIELAYDISSNRLQEPFMMEDFLNVFVMNVTIMELESTFKQDLVCVNLTSTDYGIMQVNSSIIKTIEDNLEREIDVDDLYDNIDAGSWEIFECYLLASKKHPDNKLWWAYVYYNRGMFVENTNAWKSGKSFNEANKRSKKFIKVFNKYYDCIPK